MNTKNMTTLFLTNSINRASLQRSSLMLRRLTAVFLVAVGLAIGAVTANGAPNDLFVSINGDGNNGGGFIYEYNPGGVQSTFAAGLSRPRGIALDHFGHLFVGTNPFHPGSQKLHGTIVEITPGGVPGTSAKLTGHTQGQSA